MSRPEFYEGKRAGFAGMRCAPLVMVELGPVISKHLATEGDTTPAAVAATLGAMFVAAASAAGLDRDSVIAVVEFYRRAAESGVCASDNPFEPRY